MALYLCGEAIGRRRQETHGWRTVVWYLVNEALRVFHPHAECKWFGLQHPSLVGKQTVYVAGRVAGGKDYRVAAVCFAGRVPHTFYN